jgi:hypothetical protein
MLARTSFLTALSLVTSTVAVPASVGFKDTKVGQWTIIHSVDKGANDCDMGLESISKDWGFELNLLDDASGPEIELLVFQHADANPNSIDSIDPKPVSSATFIDGQPFLGDANVATTVGIVMYSVVYRGGNADKLASRLLTGPHSLTIVVPNNNFFIPTADLGKAFAVVQQCYPLWVGHPLKWR